MVVESNDNSLFLKREFVFAGTEPLLFAEALQRGPEQFLEQGGRAVPVGVNKVDRLGALAMPTCTRRPKQQAKPLQMSRRESARPNWQKSMATNCVQQVKPLAPRSALCFLTREANSVRGKCWSS